MSILQTSPGAAPIPGFISFIVIEIGVYFICSTFIVREMRKGETFDYGNCEPIPADDAKKLPHFAIAIIVNRCIPAFRYRTDCFSGSGLRLSQQ